MDLPKKLSREELMKDIKSKQWDVIEHEHLEFLLKEFEEDLLPYLDVLIENLKTFTDSHNLVLELIERIYKKNPDVQLSIIEKLIGRFERHCDYVLFLKITKTLVRLDYPQTSRLLSEYLFAPTLYKEWALEAFYKLTKHPDEFISMVPEILTIAHQGVHEKLVKYLGEMKNEKAYNILLELTKNESFADFRGHLCWALQNYPTPKTSEYLLNIAQYGQRFHRWTAIDCLGQMQIEEAIPLLSEFYLGDEDDQIKKRAIKALIKLSKTNEEANKFLKEHYYLGDTL